MQYAWCDRRRLRFYERNSSGNVVYFDKSDAVDDCATGADKYDEAGDDVDCIKSNVTSDHIDIENDATRDFPVFGGSDVTDDDSDNVLDIRKCNRDFVVKTMRRCVVSGPLSNLLLLTMESV